MNFFSKHKTNIVGALMLIAVLLFWFGLMSMQNFMLGVGVLTGLGLLSSKDGKFQIPGLNTNGDEVDEEL